MENNTWISKLDDGLVLRRASPDDADALVKFNGEIHGEGEWDRRGLEDWTRDLISGEGPTFDIGDFTIVEDTRTSEIVSSCCTISQTWTYEGIPFKVGRPELIGTKKEYRRKGLVRQQMAVLHQWSAERGELVQVITGIPYYYRQFAYEMTLNLGGGRAGYAIHVPELKEDEKEPYRFRLAEEADIPFLLATYELGSQRSMISALWNQAQWHYELFGKSKYNINRREFYIIEDANGDRVGFISTPPLKWGKNSVVENFELAPGYAWSEVTPSVVRFLWQRGEQLGKEQDQPNEMFGFWLGEEHPVYKVMETKLPRVRKPYAFYMRMPDLPAFLNKIKPVLERRLAGSAFENYTGELKLSVYREGLLMRFEKGMIVEISTLSNTDLENSDAHFPPLTFLHLVFGYRWLDEVKNIYPDCSTKDDETGNLLDVLFPKKPSTIWPIS
jgi:hypothetical protein